jgi:hypothetical protein
LVYDCCLCLADGEGQMTYNWCHGPNCHTQHTQSRVRGSKGNKVLRTIKIKQYSNYRNYEQYSMFNYFCNQNCLMEYIRTHLQSIVAIAPRREPLETPIKDPWKTNPDSRFPQWNYEKKES